MGVEGEKRENWKKGRRKRRKRRGRRRRMGGRGRREGEEGEEGRRGRRKIGTDTFCPIMYLCLLQTFDCQAPSLLTQNQVLSQSQYCHHILERRRTRSSPKEIHWLNTTLIMLWGSNQHKGKS